MALAGLFARPAQAPTTYPSAASGLGRTGSMSACALATIAACALIFSAGAQNVAHGYSLGLASSEFRALVLAAASAGASILGPCAWLAVVRGRGIGTRAVALVLALGCLLYAGVCSLGFVAGSTDKAVSERVIAGDAYADRRALVKAARDELATLKGQSRAVMERRRELATILAPKTPETRAKPVQQDAQAAALAFYIRAAGWPVTDEAVRIWLALGLVVFLEMAAALSLTVAVALRPARGETRLEAPPAAENSPGADVPAKPETAASEPVRPASRPSADNGRQDSDDDTPPPPKPPRRPGTSCNCVGAAGRRAPPQSRLQRQRQRPDCWQAARRQVEDDGASAPASAQGFGAHPVGCRPERRARRACVTVQSGPERCGNIARGLTTTPNHRRRAPWLPLHLPEA